MELFAGPASKVGEMPKIIDVDGRGGLSFDSQDPSIVMLYHGIDFLVVSVAVVVERCTSLCPRQLSSEFAEHEVLENLSECGRRPGETSPSSTMQECV